MNPEQSPNSGKNSEVKQAIASVANNQELNNANVPKKIGEVRQLKGIVASVIILVIGIVVAVVAGAHKPVIGLAVFAGFLLVSAVTAILSIISYKQLKKSEKNPPSYNQFQTDTAVINKQPLATSVISQAETVGSWLGPVTVGGKGGVGFQVLSAEHNAQSVNTLLFTNKQAVAVFLGPQDIPQSLNSGNIKSAASTLLNLAPEQASAKDVQMVSLYAKQWQDIVNNLLQAGLSSVGQNHFNYGIPYSVIEHVEFKKSLINPGITIHLKDGKKLVYNTLRKDLLDGNSNYLKQFIQVAI